MRHNRLNTMKTEIRGDLRTAQHAGGIEYIQALVFHGAHVEVIHSDNIKDIQVILSTVDLFVPAHRLLQRAHGMPALINIFFLHINSQGDFTIIHCSKAIFYVFQIACDQGKQVGRLGERVMPHRTMAPLGKLLRLNKIAIAEQHRIALTLPFDCHGKN